MKKTLPFIFAAVILSIPLAAFRVGALDISARSAVVMVADTAEIAYEKDPHERLPIASTTKIATAVVVLENIGDIQKIVTVPKEACGIEGSSIYLYEGERITVETLLYGLLLNSGNDAAVCLAIVTAGSEEAFVALMNDFAQGLGLRDTHFENPHGLDAPEHYSSAYDLALIMRYCMENDDFSRIAGTQNVSVKMPDGSYRYFSNHNKLLRIYEHATGGKNGYTTVSGRCLVTCAEKDGVKLICVTINSHNDYSEHISLYEEFFAKYSLVRVGGEKKFTVPAVGSEMQSVSAAETKPLYLPLQNGKSAEDVKTSVVLPRFVYAPAKSGTVIGYCEYSVADNASVRIPVALESDADAVVQKTLFDGIIQFFRRLFKGK